MSTAETIPDNQSTQSLIKVSASAPTRPTADAIAHSFLRDGMAVVEVRAIGAGAVNQAVKACAIARGRVAEHGRDLVVRPGFTDIPDDNGGSASAIVLMCRME